jgi:8-oxo-dGTP pyrophosphatase MutT (NUDIX family)
MEMDRPEPGAELQHGEPAVPRPAATVILLRGRAETLEVLLVRRNPEQRFMGGAWVFPGGAVDRGEGQGDAALRAAALRELTEEAGVTLAGPDELVPFSRWITPAEVKTRFDTWFYLAPVPDGATPAVDGAECVDWRWTTPRDALDEFAADRMLLVFPTIKHLEQVGTFATADELLAHARGKEVRPVQPRVLTEGETARIVLPGEPGY